LQSFTRKARISNTEDVLSLDTATLPRNLTAWLGYLKRGAEKPAYYVIDPPPGVPRWNGGRGHSTGGGFRGPNEAPSGISSVRKLKADRL
jgi:hypothetical protein